MFLILIFLTISQPVELKSFHESSDFLSDKEIRLTPKLIYKYHYCDIKNKFEVSFAKDPKSSQYITRIPDDLFQRCHITSITFSKQITTIGFNSFFKCTIEKVKFEEDSELTTISSYAFYSVNFINPVEFPDTIEYFGESSFQNSKH